MARSPKKVHHGQTNPQPNQHKNQQNVPSSSKPKGMESKQNEVSHNALVQKRKIWLCIFKNLDFEDVLNLRLVSWKFHETMTGTKGSIHPHHTSILWSKGRVVFPHKTEEQHLELNKTVSEQSFPFPYQLVVSRQIEEFRSLQFLNSFPIPNYRLRKIDLRMETMSQFFYQNGDYILELCLDTCTFSMVTFQHIVLTCKNLKVLEIIGEFECFTQAEAIFPKKRSGPSEVLSNLRILKLKNTPTHGKHHHRQEIQNLPEAVVQDMLSSNHLKHIEINEFGFDTVLSILRCLGKKDNDKEKLLTLIFAKITTEINPTLLLIEVSTLEHQGIKIFKLEFHPKVNEVRQAWTNEFTTNNNTNLQIALDDQVILDAAITNFLNQHGSTITELDLINLPVSEKAFYNSHTQFPALYKLKLQGTRIICFSDETKVLLRNTKIVKLNHSDTIDCEFQNADTCDEEEADTDTEPIIFLGLHYHSEMDYIFMGFGVMIMSYILYAIITYFFF